MSVHLLELLILDNSKIFYRPFLAKYPLKEHDRAFWALPSAGPQSSQQTQFRTHHDQSDKKRDCSFIRLKGAAIAG